MVDHLNPLTPNLDSGSAGLEARSASETPHALETLHTPNERSAGAGARELGARAVVAFAISFVVGVVRLLDLLVVDGVLITPAGQT